MNAAVHVCGDVGEERRLRPVPWNAPSDIPELVVQCDLLERHQVEHAARDAGEEAGSLADLDEGKGRQAVSAQGNEPAVGGLNDDSLVRQDGELVRTRREIGEIEFPFQLPAPRQHRDPWLAVHEI